ncbi:tyrosine-type recombinase/integrase [Spirosoma endbachense]|uniref:Tyrosine-type recombinase/integrase n=2 Tax=Spirosoma endbachense TaxID=2666025 RepID=A0A6P1VMQ3_9BACT|nr:tyrosine-type recombinase/integrase [Spirosoma endbachense]
MPPSTRHLRRDKLKGKANNRTKYVDQLLKEVAQTAGFNKLVSMHSARHLFAEDLFEYSGDLRLVSVSLSHSDLETTQRYLKRKSQMIIDRANSVYRKQVIEESDESQDEGVSDRLASGML